MSAPQFELHLTTDPEKGALGLRLTDGDGRQLAAQQVVLGKLPEFLWEGLINTRVHVDRYSGGVRYTDRPATAEDLLDRLGVFLGEQILGPRITAALAAGVHQRTLLIRLPRISGDSLAAALARVPWEIARPAAGEAPLMERNLLVRVVSPEMEAARWTAPDPAPGAPVKVLLVYAEAPGSNPLALRQEREALLDLFYDEVMGKRRVEVDVLCHGVTRETLRRQIESAEGYHVVHWSGHGHHDLLELYPEGDEPGVVSGEEVLDLFAEAGGFIPRLVFLSACLSGTLATVESREELVVALRAEATAEGGAAAVRSGVAVGLEEGEKRLGRAEEEESADGKEASAKRSPGTSGTALALLGAGVPQVLAMRYEVGDAYARELAVRFYRALFADQSPKSPAAALNQARKALRKEKTGEQGAVDHATPLLFGRDVGPLPLAEGRAAGLDRRFPQPEPIVPGSRELDRPAGFVGRGEPLTRLRLGWLERAREKGETVPAVALIQGLAGLGKTALAAEAVNLWHRRFAGVYAFQAKPAPLSFDEFLRQLDLRLKSGSEAYRVQTSRHPNAHLYQPPRPDWTGEERHHDLVENLVAALKAEALLLVLDNFETNLERQEENGLHACTELAWERLFARLAGELPSTGSRVLVTSRHRLRCLADGGGCRTVRLGPLPVAEAWHLLQSLPKLRKLAFGGGEEGARLAVHLLEVSRGHPLILTRLAGLAGDPQALEEALRHLEAEGLSSLPDLFASRFDLPLKDREKELAYLKEVAKGSVDLLLARLSAGARRLLWVATRAFEPVPEELLAGVWAGKSLREERGEEQVAKLRAVIAVMDQLPADKRQQLETLLAQLPPEVRDRLERPAEPVAVAVPPLLPPLAELESADLLTREQGGAWAFHELVRERAEAWMARREEDLGGRKEAEVWVGYGERYGAAYKALQMVGQEGARARAAEAGRRGLTYLVRAGAFDRLGTFASGLVTGTSDPRLLAPVIAELSAAADQQPAGEDRWSVRTYLADALTSAGRADQALALYEQAAAEAEAAGHWEDVGAIYQNWAGALRDAGRLDAAQETYRRSAAAKLKAGSPRIKVVGSELEAWRVDLMQGGADAALPEIERRLAEVRGWWERHRAGGSVPEAPEPVFLGRAFVSALDIALEADLAREAWQVCLDRLTEIEEVQQALGESEHERARTRFNRYGPLLRLGRLGDAQAVLEGCLAVFRGAGDAASEAKALSSLANLWDERGDRAHAVALERQALAIRDRLPALADRAISHGNFANYLDQAGSGVEEARHRLAAIAYDLLIGYRQSLSRDLRNLAVLARRPAASGERYALPRLAEVVARPEFSALAAALGQFGREVEDLQAKIDEVTGPILAQAADSGSLP